MTEITQLMDTRAKIGEQVVTEMQQLFPVGTELSIPAGRGWAKVKVVGYGDPAEGPTRLCVENQKTGGRSMVDGSSDKVQKV